MTRLNDYIEEMARLLSKEGAIEPVSFVSTTTELRNNTKDRKLYIKNVLSWKNC